MIIYEIKDKTVYKLTAAGSVLDLAVDAALLISHLYHAQASDELKEIFREKVTGMVNCGILWENDIKSETPPSTLAFDLQMPGMDEFSERMEEQYWRRRHEEAEGNGEEEEE